MIWCTTCNLKFIIKTLFYKCAVIYIDVMYNNIGTFIQKEKENNLQ